MIIKTPEYVSERHMTHICFRFSFIILLLSFIFFGTTINLSTRNFLLRILCSSKNLRESERGQRQKIQVGKFAPKRGGLKNVRS